MKPSPIAIQVNPGWRFLLGVASIMVWMPVSLCPADPTKEQLDFFENKVRPILAANCYECHSHESGKSKGGMTLDTRDGWMKGGDDGPIIVPGDPEHSAVIRAVSYTDPDLQMPPKNKRLKEEEVEVLVQWIKMGAPDPRVDSGAAIEKKLSGLTEAAKAHWAYQAPKKASPPQVQESVWCATPVDQFIKAKLEEKQLSPAPKATREALIRRAYYDLIGIPPTPDDIHRFVDDASPTAFETVVDHLLASPHYGERWGRHWLDTVRYSDTTGDRDNQVMGVDYRYPYAWSYRDYVIQAFNEDKPYNQFVLEQLAADLLPESKSDPTRLAALGFLTVGKRFKNVNDVINDRIDVVSKTVIGQTVSCARCHDHKFDPIPTTDYYAWHGVFANTLEPFEKPVLKEKPAEQYEDFKNKLAELENQNREMYYEFIEQSQKAFHSKAESYLQILKTHQVRGGKPNAEVIKSNNELIQREHIDKYLMDYLAKERRQNPLWEPFRVFQSMEGDNFATEAAALLAKIKVQKNLAKRINPIVLAEFQKAPPTSMDDVIRVYTGLFKTYESQRETYLTLCRKDDRKTVEAYDPAVAEILQVPFRILPYSAANSAGLHRFIDDLNPQMARQISWKFGAINELELTHPGAPMRAMLVMDAPKPKDSPIFVRGQAQVRGEVVPRRNLTLFSSDGKPLPFKAGSGRLELAQGLLNAGNALAARVMVNRIWMHHFGEGLVPSPDYFGTQSQLPSHPELLDYLAIYFMEKGWSVKSLHRHIMLSSVYQESSRTNPEYEKIDPMNRLLWRANIRRLDFESFRDTLLAFSGKMDDRIGGQPVNLVDEPYSYRRSVYGYIDRGNMPDLMSQFDFPDADMPNSKRSSTVVPQQALYLMNSTMAFDTVQSIVGRQEFTQAADDIERLKKLYLIIFQREPTPKETELGLQFVAREKTFQEQIVARAAAVKRPGPGGGKPGGKNPKPQERQPSLVQEAPTAMQPQMDPKVANPKPEGVMKEDPSMAMMSPMKEDLAKGKNKDFKRPGYDVINSKKPILNDGDRVSLRPMTPWETYTQALLFSNEASYVN